MKPVDETIAIISDTHCGGTTALFPDYMMQFKAGEKYAINHTPLPFQKQLYKHFIACAGELKKRKTRLVLVINGDIIEGWHHGTIQVISHNPVHQVEIFNEVFGNFLAACGFSVKRGDKLYFVSGTEIHTGWAERETSERYSELGAEFNDELETVINGRRIWFTHHGGTVGSGPNEGDAYRVWLKKIYFDCQRDKRPVPDCVVSSHYHKTLYTSYIRDYHTMHGIVTPSWQRKTRHAVRVAPFERNDIGMSVITVTAGGDMRFERPHLIDPNILK